MKAIPINMDDVQDVSFEPLPKGRYTAVIESVMYRVGKEPPHNPYISFTWVITGPSYAGRKIFQNCTLTEKSLWNLKATLKGLDLPHKGQISINYDEVSGIVTEPQAVGKPAIIEVSVDGTFNRVDGVYPIDGTPSPINVPTSSTIPAAPSLTSAVKPNALGGLK